MKIRNIEVTKHEIKDTDEVITLEFTEKEAAELDKIEKECIENGLTLNDFFVSALENLLSEYSDRSLDA